MEQLQMLKPKEKPETRLKFKEPSGAFLLIDDDIFEHHLFKMAMKSLGYTNKLVSKLNGEEGFEYLKTTSDEVFLIMCDLNMPKMDGLELKRKIENAPKLKEKSIPFIFHSNSGSIEEIKIAYSLNIQGYFRKAIDLEGTVSSLQKIVSFWTDCLHPKDIIV